MILGRNAIFTKVPWRGNAPASGEAELPRGAGYAVTPAGAGTYVADVGAIDDLPAGVPEPIVVIASGHELLAAVEAA